MTKITGRMIRASRALLGWTQTDLARRAAITPATLIGIEQGSDAQARSTDNVLGALTAAGVVFGDDGSVRVDTVPEALRFPKGTPLETKIFALGVINGGQRRRGLPLMIIGKDED
jgi:transcriptional regulator with XRE-family HTH domain